MKKWKRAGIMLLCTCILALVMTGCQGQKPEEKKDTPKKETEAQTKTEDQETGEPADDGAFHGEYVVSAEYAKEHIKDKNILFVDARGWKKAALGTIKGAVATTWQDLSTCQEGKAGDENWGKIPEAEDFAERLGKLGMTKDKEIILLAETLGWGDDARILWELRAAGYDNVKMIDGGYDVVKAAGVETQMLAADAKPEEVSISSIDNTHVMTTEELQKNYMDYKILDVRTDEEYEGAVLYDEAKGGHLPDAIHFRYTDLFQADGTLKPNKEIVALCEAAGIRKEDKLVSYCTGGIRSAHMQLVLEMCGYENTWNYDQSYWRWAVAGEVEK